MPSKRKRTPSCACLRAALAADGTPPQLRASIEKRLVKLEGETRTPPLSVPGQKHYVVIEPSEAGRRSAKLKIRRWDSVEVSGGR